MKLMGFLLVLNYRDLICYVSMLSYESRVIVWIKKQTFKSIQRYTSKDPKAAHSLLFHSACMIRSKAPGALSHDRMATLTHDLSGANNLQRYPRKLLKLWFEILFTSMILSKCGLIERLRVVVFFRTSFVG